MRRAAVTIVATVVGLILLLQFKTHPATSTGSLVTLGQTTPTSRPTPHRTPHHHPAASPTPSTPSTHRATPQHRAAPTTVAPTHRAKPPAAKPKTITGQTVQTPYGPVQVRIVETAGRLTDVVPVQLPSGNPRSTEIAAGATPLLRTEALRANSARIHVVSGATYTSNGYAQSLQSALDHA